MSEFKPKYDNIYISFPIDSWSEKKLYCTWYSSFDDASYCVQFNNRYEFLNSPPCFVCKKRDDDEPIFKRYWICFDLANGHGQQHYCWVFKTREQARKAVRNHKENDYAALSQPEAWYINF